MSTSILELLAEDGIKLSVSEDGNLDIVGDTNAVNSWLQVIKENKSTILAELRGESGLEEQEQKYSILVADAGSDPVLVKVGIKGIATFDLEIPRARHDGIALLEALEKHSAEAEPQRKAA